MENDRRVTHYSWHLGQVKDAQCLSTLTLSAGHPGGQVVFRCVQDAGHAYAHTTKDGGDVIGFQVRWWDEDIPSPRF